MYAWHGWTRAVLRAATGAALTAALMGCSETRDGEMLRLAPSPKPYAADIPLPDGFKMVESSMEDHSTGQTRTYLRHTYMGKDDKFAVREFYREQMPLNRWAMISDSAIKGNFSMRFAKGSEACVINIEDNGKSLGRKTLIQVMISPEKRGSRPPAGQGQR